jgi:hypothetical protein
MYGGKTFNRFQLNDYFTFNEKIDLAPAFEVHFLVNYGDTFLAFKS